MWCSSQSLLSLFTTSAVFLLDSEGNRLLAKYYSPASKAALSSGDAKATLINGVPLQASAFKTLKEQRNFESAVWDKTKKSNCASLCTVSCACRLLIVWAWCMTADIILYNGQLILFKNSIDLTFYVVGEEAQNELMLQGVLTAFYDAVSLLLRHQVEKRAILENLDLVVLCLDETIDEGCVLPLSLVGKLRRRTV